MVVEEEEEAEGDPEGSTERRFIFLATFSKRTSGSREREFKATLVS